MSFREAFKKVVKAVKDAVALPEGFYAQPQPIPIRVTADTRHHPRPHRPNHW
jgi:hypothetical protein